MIHLLYVRSSLSPLPPLTLPHGLPVSLARTFIYHSQCICLLVCVSLRDAAVHSERARVGLALIHLTVSLLYLLAALGTLLLLANSLKRRPTACANQTTPSQPHQFVENNRGENSATTRRGSVQGDGMVSCITSRRMRVKRSDLTLFASRHRHLGRR